MRKILLIASLFWTFSVQSQQYSNFPAVTAIDTTNDWILYLKHTGIGTLPNNYYNAIIHPNTLLRLSGGGSSCIVSCNGLSSRDMVWNTPYTATFGYMNDIAGSQYWLSSHSNHWFEDCIYQHIFDSLGHLSVDAGTHKLWGTGGYLSFADGDGGTASQDIVDVNYITSNLRGTLGYVPVCTATIKQVPSWISQDMNHNQVHAPVITADSDLQGNSFVNIGDTSQMFIKVLNSGVSANNGVFFNPGLSGNGTEFSYSDVNQYISTPAIVGNSTTPSTVAGPASNGGTVSVTGNCLSGTISVTTGTGLIGTGTIVTITYNATFPNGSVLIITPYETNAVTAPGIYTQGSTTNGTINTGVHLTTSTTYVWNYIIVGQ